VGASALAAPDGYPPLAAPTLCLPYPRLRGYRYGLAPALGAFSGAWLAVAVIRTTRFFRQHGVKQVVSIPHSGPFALVGLLAARRLGIDHTLYILDAWEEAATGPIERRFIQWGLRLAARMPRSRLAVVSPALGSHYRRSFGFRDATWIPNPAPIPDELTAPHPSAEPFVLFTGIIKPFNIATLRAIAASLHWCRIIRKLVVTGQAAASAGDLLRRAGEPGDGRVEFRLCTPAEIAALQRQAAVLLVATQVDDTSQTSLGYLPGRLPEYVATGRPILVIGPPSSDAARAVRHWGLGETSATQDEAELARLLDDLATRATSAPPDGGSTKRDLFLQLFSRAEARRRLFGEPSAPLSNAAATLAAEFEKVPGG
jgi:hypothetical protein